MLDEYSKIQVEQERLEEQSDIMNKTSVTFRDYTHSTDFDGKYGLV